MMDEEKEYARLQRQIERESSGRHRQCLENIVARHALLMVQLIEWKRRGAAALPDVLRIANDLNRNQGEWARAIVSRVRSVEAGQRLYEAVVGMVERFHDHTVRIADTDDADARRALLTVSGAEFYAILSNGARAQCAETTRLFAAYIGSLIRLGDYDPVAQSEHFYFFARLAVVSAKHLGLFLDSLF
jgi:hypothetical protein